MPNVVNEVRCIETKRSAQSELTTARVGIKILIKDYEITLKVRYKHMQFVYYFSKLKRHDYNE